MTNKSFLNNYSLSVFLIAALIVLSGGAAFAQENSGQPIEIEADDALEWDRENKSYTAKGNASAVQGDTSVKAQTLIADYRETEDSGNQIWRLTALSEVRLISPEGTAYGEKAVYLIDEARAEMTGRNLRLKSPDQLVTARDKFIYFTDENRFEAMGDVVVIRDEDTLRSDKVISFFKNNDEGQRVLDKLEAHGNVVIVTPEETLKGRVGTYDPDTEIAELVGNVSIERGPNLIQGNRATVNLKTNISRVFGAPKAGERVKGVFYPQNTDDNDNDNDDNEPDTSNNPAEPKTN